MLFNCRNPNYLDAAAGDRKEDAWVGNHLPEGLAAQAVVTLLMAAAYCLARGSPARRPWSAAEAVAAAACLAGTALRAWCFSALGRLFTYEVSIRTSHQLVTTGPYALLLHPSYTGTAMVALGFCGYIGLLRRWRGLLAVMMTVGAALGKPGQLVLRDGLGKA